MIQLPLNAYANCVGSGGPDCSLEIHRRHLPFSAREGKHRFLNFGMELTRQPFVHTFRRAASVNCYPGYAVSAFRFDPALEEGRGFNARFKTRANAVRASSKNV